MIDPELGIAFNGDARSGQDYESFRLRAPSAYSRSVWAFCKTERRPYDLAVGAVLLRCRLLLPEVFALNSTGTWSDWDLPGSGLSPAVSIRGLVGELFGGVPADSPFGDTNPPRPPIR